MHHYFRGQVTPWPSAIGLSLAIHAGMLALVGQTKWSRAVIRAQPALLEVYLSDWLPTPARIDTPAEQTPASTTDSVGAEPEQTGEASSPAPANLDSDSGGDTDGNLNAERPAPIPRSIDWQEEARRSAVRLREQQARADAYVTFGNPFSEEAPTGLGSAAGQQPNGMPTPDGAARRSLHRAKARLPEMAR